MGYFTRALLGSADEPLVHDPGPEGESGEGDAAMVMLCLTYFATVGILIYGENTNFPKCSFFTFLFPPRRRQRDDACQFVTSYVAKHLPFLRPRPACACCLL
jgi:hypothetical protein